VKRTRCCVLCLVSVLCVTSARTQSIHQLNVVRVRVAGSPGQEFACVSPYTFAECERQVAILEPILHRYAAEKLGKWTWVLVRSEDWKQILTELHLNPNSPAFSHLEMRQTFVEEVLLVPEPERQVELLEKWHIPFDQFLDFAISHEMGHALCHESDEIKAERYAELLRKGSSSECATHQQQFWGRSFFSHFDKSRVLGNQGLPVPAQFASPEPVLAVLVYNYSEATPELLDRAEKETQRIFERMEIHIGWTNCPIHPVSSEKSACYEEAAPGQVRLRILKQPLNDSFRDSIFGFALAPEFASVYFDAAARLTRISNEEFDLATMMGCLIAHEVGHLLLGENRHSASGIMKAKWELRQVQQAMMGSLGFLPEEKTPLHASVRERESKAEAVRRKP